LPTSVIRKAAGESPVVNAGTAAMMPSTTYVVAVALSKVPGDQPPRDARVGVGRRGLRRWFGLGLRFGFRW